MENGILTVTHSASSNCSSGVMVSGKNESVRTFRFNLLHWESVKAYTVSVSVATRLVRSFASIRGSRCFSYLAVEGLAYKQ